MISLEPRSQKIQFHKEEIKRNPKLQIAIQAIQTLKLEFGGTLHQALLKYVVKTEGVEMFTTIQKVFFPERTIPVSRELNFLLANEWLDKDPEGIVYGTCLPVPYDYQTDMESLSFFLRRFRQWILIFDNDMKMTGKPPCSITLKPYLQTAMENLGELVKNVSKAPLEHKITRLMYLSCRVDQITTLTSHLFSKLAIYLQANDATVERLGFWKRQITPVMMALNIYLNRICASQKKNIPADTFWLEVIDFTEPVYSPRSLIIPEKSQPKGSIPITIPYTAKKNETFEAFKHLSILLNNRFKEFTPFLSLVHTPMQQQALALKKLFKVHLLQASIGFDVLLAGLASNQTSSLLVTAPMILLDLSICLEALCDLFYGASKLNFPLSHSLIEKMEKAGKWEALPAQVKRVLQHFDKASVWCRYPHASSRQFPSKEYPLVLQLLLQIEKFLTTPNLKPFALNPLLFQLEGLIKEAIQTLAFLLDTQVNTSPFTIYTDEAHTHSIIDFCELYPLFDQYGQTAFREAKSHLMRMEQAVLLFPLMYQNHRQAWHFRNALSFSLTLEQLFMGLCQHIGCGTVPSHRLQDYMEYLEIEGGDFAEKFSFGKEMEYFSSTFTSPLIARYLSIEKLCRMIALSDEKPALTEEEKKLLFSSHALFEQIERQGLSLIKTMLVK